MARRGEIIVQNAGIPLALGTRPRYKRRVHWAAQRGWQISGEVVVPAAQSCLGIRPPPTRKASQRVPRIHKLCGSGNFSFGGGVYSFARRAIS
jgi:hypothetical protein